MHSLPFFFSLSLSLTAVIFSPFFHIEVAPKELKSSILNNIQSWQNQGKNKSLLGWE
jgi:hypothetical protein